MEVVLPHIAAFLSYNDVHLLMRVCKLYARVLDKRDDVPWVYMITFIPKCYVWCVDRALSGYNKYMFIQTRITPYIGMDRYYPIPTCRYLALKYYHCHKENAKVANYYLSHKAREAKIEGGLYSKIGKFVTTSSLQRMLRRITITQPEKIRLLYYHLKERIKDKDWQTVIDLRKSIANYSPSGRLGCRVIIELCKQGMQLEVALKLLEWTEIADSFRAYLTGAFGKIESLLYPYDLEVMTSLLGGSCKYGNTANIIRFFELTRNDTVTVRSCDALYDVRTMLCLDKCRKEETEPCLARPIIQRSFYHLRLEGIDTLPPTYHDAIHQAYENSCQSLLSKGEYHTLHRLLLHKDKYYQGEIVLDSTLCESKFRYIPVRLLKYARIHK